MLHKKFLLCFVVIVLIVTFFPFESSAQMGKKTYTLIHGCFSLAQKMGSNSDYVPGENDFPITPAHIEYGGGTGLLVNLSNMFALQFTADYLLGAKVEKEDPSDGETFDYKTYNNINVLGSVIVKFGGKTIFFLNCGGGVNILTPYADKEVTGSLGSIIVLEPPDKTINPMACFGGGVIFAKKKIIFKIEALYTMIFDYGKNAILFRAGVGF